MVKEVWFDLCEIATALFLYIVKVRDVGVVQGRRCRKEVRYLEQYFISLFPSHPQIDGITRLPVGTNGI